MYTKTALSILNMGFTRGLSPHYMKSAPHITTWITSLLEDDPYLKKNGFAMLGEVATVGFENTYYAALDKTNAQHKLLSALWRESPYSKLGVHETAMTMAGLLHLDKAGDALLVALIKASPYTVTQWLQKYLQAYLSPLLHCFYKYGFVFMPHGENIILALKQYTPVRILMKDITEEVVVFNPDLELPKHVKRLYVETDDAMQVLSIFTDVFDCFFRYMGPILEKQLRFSQHQFWKQVALCIQKYQAAHPEYNLKYERYDLFTPKFGRCCLNRLQLRNTQQMLNLSDPIASLIIEGELQNPIAKFKKNLSTYKAVQTVNHV
jgi:siderophore synthetase component